MTNQVSTEAVVVVPLWTCVSVSGRCRARQDAGGDGGRKVAAPGGR